ncbi:MAG: hypothetical protein AB8B83_03485 [Bdellovibrionales bacterium]
MGLDPTTESAIYVLSHLLTKDETLSVQDIHAIQRAVLDTGNGNFDRPNGSFGPGTSSAVISFLGSEHGIHLVNRLSDPVREALIAEGYEADLGSLSGAVNALESPEMTIEGLLAAPYRLSEEEMVFLHTELHSLGMYQLDSHEFTEYADGSPTSIHPDGLIGRDTILGIQQYIAANPEAVLQNPAIASHASQIGWVETLTDIAESSTGYRDLVGEMVEINTGRDVSSENYRLQMVLEVGGHGGQPDGSVGQDTEAAIQRAEASWEESSLGGAWENKGQDFASNTADPVIPAADITLDIPTVT